MSKAGLRAMKMFLESRCDGERVLCGESLSLSSQLRCHARSQAALFSEIDLLETKVSR